MTTGRLPQLLPASRCGCGAPAHIRGCAQSCARKMVTGHIPDVRLAPAVPMMTGDAVRALAAWRREVAAQRRAKRAAK